MLFRFKQPRASAREEEILSLPLDGAVHPVKVARRAQARRLTLSLHPARRITLTVPRRCSQERMRDFLAENLGWLRLELAALPISPGFTAGGVIPLRGEPHVIAHRPGKRGVTHCENGTVYVTGQAVHLPRRVKEFLKKEAMRDLQAACERYASLLGVKVKRIGLRDMRSRWGSSSSNGTLSFSWRLVCAPPFVLDYLAAHEVAHLREMNHSKRFWKLVHGICPRAQEAEAWFKQNGKALLAIRA